jgi:N-acetylmuramoyl-L-alanine amidase
MRQLLLSAGHSTDIQGDRGAQGIRGIWEGDLTEELRKGVITKLKSKGFTNIITDEPKNALAKTLAYFKSFITSKTIAIDIHYNAFNSNARGCECIIPENPSTFERQLATQLVWDIVNPTSIPNRGVKKESNTARRRLAWMRQDCETVLIEVCFIDNTQDMMLYTSYKNTIEDNIANTIIKFSKL